MPNYPIRNGKVSNNTCPSIQGYSNKVDGIPIEGGENRFLMKIPSSAIEGVFITRMKVPSSANEVCHICHHILHDSHNVVCVMMFPAF